MDDQRLSSILADIWRRLEQSAGLPGAPYGLAVLATNSSSGQPCQRMVVLRELDAVAGEVRCYTDCRSPKVIHIQAQPFTSWLFYDAEDRVQITLKAEARIISDGPELQSAWERCRPESRRNFQSLLAPGTPLGSPPPEVQDESSFLQDTHEFAIISAHVLEIDWLKLRPAGNYRAHFKRVEETWLGEWLAP